MRLRTAIQKDPGNCWTVSEIADYLQVSPGYLLNIYKKAFGVSCMDDVIRSRIRLAKEFLIHSAESIADIASHCGYQNVEHFCRQFKKITGESPRTYQKQYKYY
ncbi:helix-turn-helix domain-containing protein [Cohnella endophytica]|uniref:helix-turn-helix domain-containing protein n=1 Tax=Cohnella endophytica TaxID=2419778 RepID=UPI002688BC2B|nr:AraC family transcriptional regulator [Cohnella endophytica]